MADEPTLNTPATGADQVPKPGATEATTPDPASADGDMKLFTQADLDRIATKVRSEEKARQEKETARLRQQSEQQRLTEQGEYKTLHEQSEARVHDLETEVNTLRLENLRASVAAKHRLPEELGRRLQGSTKEEMDADAVKMAKLILPPKAPDTEGGTRAGGEVNASKAAESQKKELESTGRYARY